MPHKYKINNTYIIDALLRHVKQSKDINCLQVYEQKLEFHTRDSDVVILDVPYITTTGLTSKFVTELINTYCSEVNPTVSLDVTAKELSAIEYVLNESSVLVCVPDVKSLSLKIGKAKQNFINGDTN